MRSEAVTTGVDLCFESREEMVGETAALQRLSAEACNDNINNNGGATTECAIQ
jgi:hypothetical protein